MSSLASPSTRIAPAPILRPCDFRRLQQIAYERFGFDLREGKEEMVSARLSNRVRELGFPSYSGYLDHVTSSAGMHDFSEMVDLLTTNFTSFFREIAHFEFLDNYLAAARSRQQHVRIWSSACSSGEEPYSLAISALESADVPNVSILATDISGRILNKAKTGVYPLQRLAGVSPERQRNYFLRGQGKAAGLCRVKPAVSSLVNFQALNLVQPFTHSSAFNMIWCRNVMIYFDLPTQERVVANLSNWLVPGGYLLIGHSEALNGIQHSLRYVQPAVYQK